ncbi:two-component sensor histidine kinase [Bosea sp. OAE506]|uniref:sensor histidine kinase n=1 Tax=Bosea sp. OAE506 TaxID=2663870 RepID=UPI00178AE4AD
MKKRLFLLATAALTPGAALLGINEVTYRAEREQEVHRMAQQASRQAASELERIIEGIDGLLIAVAANAEVSETDPSACSRALAAVAASVSSVRVIFLMSVEGRIVCDSVGASLGHDLSDRGYLQEALVSDRTAVGEYTHSRITDTAVLPLARAVRDARGEVRGVLATGIRLDWLGERLRERGVTPSGALTVADRKGVILARYPLPERFVGTRIPAAFRHLLRGPKPGSIDLTSQDGEARIVGYQPVGMPLQGLYVSAGLARSEAFAALNRSSLIGGIIVGFGALLTFAAAWFVGNAFVRRPIMQINQVLASWRHGESRHRTGMRGSQGEIESVGHAVDDLLDELAVREEAAIRAREQRDLATRELAHRVKNLLTVLQAIARQTFGPYVDAERSQIFSDRVVALSAALDVLLSDEDRQGAIGDIIATTLRPHVDRLSRISSSGPIVRLEGKMGLALSMIVHELATNALKYGALKDEEGRVEIHWDLDAEGRITLLWRECDGPPVLPPDRQGFGSRLIRRALPAECDPQVELDFPPTGLVLRLSFNTESRRPTDAAG